MDVMIEMGGVISGEIFAGDFLVECFGVLFTWHKTGGNHPQQNLNQKLGASRPKSTLQESGLHNLKQSREEESVQHHNEKKFFGKAPEDIFSTN